MDDKGAGQVAAAGTAVDAPATATAWDPYQVWLTRVQQPRERIARLRVQQRRIVEQPVTEFSAKPADPTLA